MDIQLLLVFILAILAVSLTAVCIYVIITLKEFRETLRKTNVLLDDAHYASETLVNPTTAMLGVASTILETIKTVKSIRTIADQEEY